jgi:hypothetical protein
LSSGGARTLLIQTSLLLGGMISTAVADCGPWDGTPACYRNNGSGISGMYSWASGGAVCYQNQTLTCHNGKWAVRTYNSCDGKPDTPSLQKPGDVPRSCSDDSSGSPAFDQSTSKPSGLMGNIGRMGTPLGGGGVSGGGAGYAPPAPTPPVSTYYPSNPNFNRNASGGANSTQCAQLLSQISQYRSILPAYQAQGQGAPIQNGINQNQAAYDQMCR